MVRPSPLGSCDYSPKKNPFQGCVSHLFLPYLVLSSPSPRAENGRNSSKVLLPTFKSPLIFSLSSVRSLHVLEMEESTAKFSFPLSDHPQSFLYHWSDLSLMVHFFPFIFFSPSLNQLLYSHGDGKNDRKRFPSPLPTTLHPL